MLAAEKFIHAYIIDSIVAKVVKPEKKKMKWNEKDKERKKKEKEKRNPSFNPRIQMQPKW